MKAFAWQPASFAMLWPYACCLLVSKHGATGMITMTELRSFFFLFFEPKRSQRMSTDDRVSLLFGGRRRAVWSRCQQTGVGAYE